MWNEQLCFGLSQVLRKFPKETGKPKGRKNLNKVKEKKNLLEVYPSVVLY
jgi:hypothetical protein